MNKAAILIIALSARPFVAAAIQAGYSVTAIDAFADVQTLASADKTITVDFDEHGFNAPLLLKAINSLDASAYIGFIFGSGFDDQPELLQAIAERIPLIGNSAATVCAVKTSARFFDALLALNIPYPPVFKILPDVDIDNIYLKKSAGGCGGTHISIASPQGIANSQNQLAVNQYYQQYIEGRSVSLLFLAHGDAIEVIGINEQWVSGNTEMPFRYGGAVSHIDLVQDIQQQLIDVAKKLTIKFGLLGLNSLDAVIKNNIVYVLEINPRLSATFDLYDEDLFNRHLHAVKRQSSDELDTQKVNQGKVAKAQAIVYAGDDTIIAPSFDWPEWVTDIPAVQLTTMTIKSGEPICTVLASAQDAETAKQLVMARVKILYSAFR